MAESPLAHVPSELERQIEPVVVSEANPDPRDLLDVRAEVQSTPRIQEVFRKAFDEKWSAERLTDLLTTEIRILRQDDSDPTEAARFLADEFTQIGPAGVHLISTTTGRIAAIIREEDIYQPAPVPREGTSIMAQPLPRIRPDLETAIVTWFHDKGREERILETLAARGHQTALMREMGDPRLLVATKKGRRHIVNSLAKIDPKLLLESAGGRAGTFLRQFTILEGSEDPPDNFVLITGDVSAKSIMGVQDPLTTNLHHNRPAALRAALVGGWIRHLALILSQRVHRSVQGDRPVLDLLDRNLKVPGGFWVAPPDFVRPLVARSPKVEVFPVEGSEPFSFELLQQKMGYLRIPREFGALSQDFFDRWETSAHLHFDMWVDFSRIWAFELHGVDLFTQVL
jgi:hypothetical protein